MATITPDLRIETERLILRPVTKGDGSDIHAIFQDPRFQYAGADAVNKDGFLYTERRCCITHPLTKNRPFCIYLGIRLKSDQDKVIGYRSFGDKHVLPRLSKYGLEGGSFMHPDFRRQKYASEAIAAAIAYLNKEYGYKKYYGTAHPQNTASIKVMKSSGYNKEETLTAPEEYAFWKDIRNVYAVDLDN